MNVRHLTFRLLQVYVAVVRTGSITQAATQLHLTQPTVSQQIKRLTEAVGEELLVMTDTGYRPTYVGEELYRAALDALTRFDDFGHLLEEAREGKQGQFSIGVVTTAKYVLPRLITPFSRDYPGVEVSLHIGNRGSVLQRFEQQLDDLYIFSHPPSGKQAAMGRFLRNPLVIIAPAHHWAAQRQSITFDELLQEKFLIREPGSATRMVFENWLREHQRQLTKTIQIESNEVIRMSVEAGMGLAVLSQHTLDVSAGKLAILPVEGFPLSSSWYMVRRADRQLSKAAENFIQQVDQHLVEWMDAQYLCNEIKNIFKQ